MQIQLFWLILLLFPCTLCYMYIQTGEHKVKKGEFFSYMLHSRSLFNQTVPVKWSATIKGKPALPQWLHILPSKHAPIAYLIGTPVTPDRQIAIHLIAKRTDTFGSQQMNLIITLDENVEFTNSTTQIFDLTIKNVDAEEFIYDRTGLVKKLEKSISDMFKGKYVKPYIFKVQSQATSENIQQARYQKFGSIISIGTQRGFYPNVYTLVENLRKNANYCKNTNQVIVNRFFTPTFDVDWCQVQLKNITVLHELMDAEAFVKYTPPPIYLEPDQGIPPTPPSNYYTDRGDWLYFFVIFPTFGFITFFVLLVLTYIFFGKRTGQDHRDRNTPKDQLEEFISVRESQRHLRELSVQRQLLLMANERDNSAIPSGIHSFLQPKSRAPTSISGSTRFSKSASRLNEHHVAEDVGENIPVGKQTVAEAAKQCGSSLHLYRNPLDTESEEENETDSLE